MATSCFPMKKRPSTWSFMSKEAAKTHTLTHPYLKASTVGKGLHYYKTTMAAFLTKTYYLLQCWRATTADGSVLEYGKFKETSLIIGGFYRGVLSYIPMIFVVVGEHVQTRISYPAKGD